MFGFRFRFGLVIIPSVKKQCLMAKWSGSKYYWNKTGSSRSGKFLWLKSLLIQVERPVVFRS